MDTAGFQGAVYRMEPRVPMRRRAEGFVPAPSRILGSRVPSRILPRSTASSTTECKDANLCEKPAGVNTTVPIVIGVCAAVALIVVLIYLHRRNMKKQSIEDKRDPHKSLDFGLGEKRIGKRKSIMLALGGGDKPSQSRRQLSMDMNLSSPYLLPPELHNSRESLNSLSRTLHQNDDPYRPVTQLAMSDVGSIRSFEKGSSIYTASTRKRESVAHPGYPASIPPTPRQNSFPKGASPPAVPMPAKLEPQVAVIEVPEPYLAKDPFLTPTSEVAPPYPDDTPGIAIQEPAPTARKNSLNGVPPRGEPTPAILTPGRAVSDNFPRSHGATSPPDSAIGLGLVNGTAQSSPAGSLPVSPQPQQPQHVPAPQGIVPVIEEASEFYDYDYHVQEPQSAGEHEDRGRSRNRESQYPREGGLGVPQQDKKRLSVGFRPLPPDDAKDSEDPEYRANRIRSFYKEYFEEAKPDPNAPPMPAPPGRHYEDYDANYGGDAAFFDPETNQFVLPYAQPVTRRAMTPPPSGSRFPGPRGPGPRGPGPRGPGGPGGPRGPPRGYHGSISGMSLGGPPPRPGSAMTDHSGPGPRPGSSASGYRPRAGSAMSAGPRKPMAPPTDLNTLPTPSRLRDDSAIFNAADFAPPESFKDRTRGRSQSPFGERRPYQLNVPVASPLVSAFDEMAALPSPHVLRKSGTFTALDFAPPRKFKDADTMSDAGSIRSNRSGISATQLGAIRGGAGRVSRLPGDTIFTQAQLEDKLKPSWTLRP